MAPGQNDYQKLSEIENVCSDFIVDFYMYYQTFAYKLYLTMNYIAMFFFSKNEVTLSIHH